MLVSLIRRFFEEIAGTYILVFAGCGAIVINNVSGGAVTHPGIAATFGLVVMVLIYVFGASSGAHLNPAVTLGLFAAGHHNGRDVLPYIAAQLIGALMAASTLAWMFPEQRGLGATLPHGSDAQSFVLEVILTAILMLVVLVIVRGTERSLAHAGQAIGATVGLEALFAGPISGASMNPARSLGPAVLSGEVDALWIYLVAPTLGALMVALLARFSRTKVD